MAASKKTAGENPRLGLYQKVVEAVEGVEIKGAANPYTSMNGNMYSYVHPSNGLAMKLPAEEREKFLKKYKTTLFEAYGVVQKEYVKVPDSLLAKTKELQPYFAMSHEYAKTLRPKATKKK